MALVRLHSDEQEVSDGGKRGFWWIDGRVPVALILTLIVAMLGQTALAIWWGSGLTSAVANQDIRITHLEADKRTDSTIFNDMRVLLGRIDERTALWGREQAHLGDKK